MSGLASSALVFVVQFGGRCSNNNRRRKKRRQHGNDNWQVCDSLWLMPSALSSAFSFLLLIFLVILCSIGSNAGVKGSETSVTSVPAAWQTNAKSNNGVPTFDVNDLKNLIEIFPEFREYVLKVVSSQVEQQQQQQQQQRNAYVATTPAAITSLIRPTSGYSNNANDGFTSPNSRKDFFSYSAHQQNKQSTDAEKSSNVATAKDSFGWGHYYDDHYDKHHGYDSYSYPSNSYGYGYGPSPSHHHHGWGWSSEPSHHEIIHKDPKYHYQVGYQLGKDFSCVLGLLGFKSVKDFSLHSIFSFLKKLKYLVLIGLAFKLGIILSPLALPTLLPLILLAVIAKILPLLLIICLLFKLLKTQLKFGIGKRNGEIGNGVNSISSLLEGTNISMLWESIEDVTQSVVNSETCVEKLVCKITQRSLKSGLNSTFVGDDDLVETSRGIGSIFFGSRTILPRFMENVVDWIFPKRKWKLITKGDEAEKIWECDKIQC